MIFFDLPFNQNMVDFAIPFLDEDIPLYLDPFLLWKSSSQIDNGLHNLLTNCFNYLIKITNKNQKEKAIDILIKFSECNEVGLGFSGKRKGLKIISTQTAEDIIKIFKNVYYIRENGFIHFEELQLYINGIGEDRISDFSCNSLKDILIDFTMQHLLNIVFQLKK